ncbi:GPW/gp25 family protein [Brevibacillus humidisoli]|uniref:GPW/gp25 family protein n=1 Tax=Brevibacillus humidisoli TaxID=2895522 RepID=UPI001E3357B4|nr:GPW/gp25 family protein [Brevibacillus humidisoli]UFJ38949.1 GPW/gp25 family protein [Brevibacillus humidisoli]
MGRDLHGIGWKFPVVVDAATGRIKMASYEDDIAEAIRIILWTEKGERVMRPHFGTTIRPFVFGTTNETSLRLLEANVKEAIEDWEPRVGDVEVKAEVRHGQAGSVSLSIRYLVKATNRVVNLVYPFNLSEGTY